MPRVDALATLYFFRPLRRLLPLAKSRVPILMYHSISGSEAMSGSAGAEPHPYYRTSTAPEVFESHMRYLSANGYSSISLADTVASLKEGRSAAEHPVAITFDDGYRNFYTEAFPILAKYGFEATVFLPTAFIGNAKNGDANQTFKNLDCMTWDQVREAARAGIRFGSHTVSHPQLSSLKMHDVQREIEGSKSTIEEELGDAVTSFAYPYAFPETNPAFTSQLRALLENAGYQNGVCTILGTAGRNEDPFFMRRLPVNSCDDLRLFEAKLHGGYDWLHTLQYVSKLGTKSVNLLRSGA